MAESPSTTPDPTQERETDQPAEMRSLPLVAACAAVRAVAAAASRALPASAADGVRP